jgi:hypothetical protein
MSRKKEPEIPIADAWGFGALMATAAVRYCLGRRTYIVGACVDWLEKVWPLLPEQCRVVIQRDVEEAVTSDDDDRISGASYRHLGDDCDRAEWLRARRLWA